MMAVVNATSGVAGAKLRSFTNSGSGFDEKHKTRINVYYTYRHHILGIYPAIGWTNIDITDMIISKKGQLLLGDIAGRASDLNDIDNGLPGIANRWQEQCHVSVETIYN